MVDFDYYVIHKYHVLPEEACAMKTLSGITVFTTL